MIPVQFDYAAPSSLDAAIDLLKTHEKAQILAGGHTLIAAMKQGQASPSFLVDLGKITALQGITTPESGILPVGGMTTYDQVARDPAIREHYPALAEAVQGIGDPQIRNWGRVGDLFAYQGLACDLAAVALALGASFKTVGVGGNRTLTASELIDLCLQTQWQPQEIVISLDFPVATAGVGTAYQALRHPASNYAICGVAVWVERSTDNVVSQCRVVEVGVTSSPLRLEAVEAAITGKTPSAEKIADSAALAMENAIQAINEKESLTLLSDLYASSEYRTQMLKVLTKRSLTLAVERAKLAA
ncbi:MAG: FAD binding domain-containing protein [Crocosphaera sp.]|nr:FAD binding domain-containing protein [Crocosphaera sp.]